MVSTTESLAAVVLAAGAGARLRPLTHLRPKALCPVGNVALVDHAIERVASLTSAVAVNVHHGRDALVAHLDGRVHLSVEAPEALGTAGALGALRGWIAGRATVVVNGDTWSPGGLAHLVDGWDGDRTRVLVADGDTLTPTSRIAGALMPWHEVREIEPAPSGLWERSWRQLVEVGRLEVVRHPRPCVDCGTVRDYLAANLAASGGESVVGPGAVVEGELVRSVVWPGAVVGRRERLVDAVRATDGVTVLVR